MPAWAGTRRASRPRDPHPQHPWRSSRGRRQSHCFGISHRSLGSRPARRRSCARAERSGRRPLRRSVHRPLRWPDAGHAGHDGLAPFRNDAAVVLRRLMRSLPTRSGVLGIATCDKGLPAMMMALASAGNCPPSSCPAESLCCPNLARMPPKPKLSAHDSCRSRSPSNTPPKSAAGPAPHPAEAASSWEPPPPRRSSPKLSASPSLTPRSLHPDNRSGSTPPAAPHARCCGCVSFASARQASSPPPPSRMPWSCTPPSAARQICCSICPPSPMPLVCRVPPSPTGHT